MESSALTVLLLLGALPAVLGIVMPAACVGQPMCCPMFNGSVCGEKLSRGNCVALPGGMPASKANFKDDERMKYPEKFFNATCRCKGNYDGPACQYCKFGYSGDDCKKFAMRIRRNMMTMSQAERSQFYAELCYCKEKKDPDWASISTPDRSKYRSYTFGSISFLNQFIMCHSLAVQQYRVNGILQNLGYNFAHKGPAFFCWHRLFLLYFERAMQRCTNNPTWSLPYLPIDQYKDFPLADNDNFCKNDVDGNFDPDCFFSTWWCYCDLNSAGAFCMMDSECDRSRITRNPGGSKPNTTQILACLDKTTFNDGSGNDCSTCLEGRHDETHGYCGGNMGDIYLSTCDPAFCPFHAHMDCIFQKAIEKNKFNSSSYPNTNKMGQGRNDTPGAMYTTYRLPDMMQSSAIFGYKCEDWRPS